MTELKKSNNILTGDIIKNNILTGTLNNKTIIKEVPTTTIEVGKVEYGDIPSVKNSGTMQNAVFDFVLNKYDDTDIQQEINSLNTIVDQLDKDVLNIENNITTLQEENDEMLENINYLDDIKINKHDTYNKQQIDELISSIENVSIKVVEDLPEIGQTNIIYFVHRPDPEFDDLYNEYIWENNQYELIGNTLIDLSDYITNDNLSNILTEYCTKEEIDNKTKGFATTSSLIAAINNCEPKLANSVDYSFQQISYGNGESGYRKYKNGMLEQWGVTTSSANGESEFNLHQAHIDTNFSIFIEPRERGNFYHYALPTANQKFACRIQTRDSLNIAIKFQWRSWGRWK